MGSWEFEVARAPEEERARELWLQHAAGFILMQDVRIHALRELPATLSAGEREIAEKAIDAAVYGLMQVVDGVSGGLRNERERISLSLWVTHEEIDPAGNDRTLASMNLFEGDGMCMGVHDWYEGEFGDDPVAVPRPA